jgi:hypothetical protein
LTILEDDGNYYQPLYIRENRGWTDQEAKDFVKEVEELKDLWYPEFINAPQADISTRKALANLGSTSRTCVKIERENAERHEENERRKQDRLRKIKQENKNLEWPKPADIRFKIRKPFDYWKDGCLYCSDYKPKTTHDYEVHIVTKHPGRPAYPGPADAELYRLKLPDEDDC